MKDIISRIRKTWKKGGWVFTAGNGGSATTAEHLATDLVKKGVKAMCLNSNSSVITMIANDFGYEFIFSKQLELYVKKEDLLIAFSVSGESPNILNAIAGRNHILIKGKEGETYQTAEDRHLKLAHEISLNL